MNSKRVSALITEHLGEYPPGIGRLVRAIEQEVRLELSTFAAPGPKEEDSYVQRVPDKCDRVVWRNEYIHLPTKKEPFIGEGIKKLHAEIESLQTALIRAHATKDEALKQADRNFEQRIRAEKDLGNMVSTLQNVKIKVRQKSKSIPGLYRDLPVIGTRVWPTFVEVEIE